MATTSKEDKHSNDMKLVARFLHENPTSTQKRIADSIGLTDNQVKHALEDLRVGGHVVHCHTVDLDYLGYRHRYRVDIFVNPAQLRAGKGGLPDDSDIDSQQSLARYIMKILPNRVPFAETVLVEDVRVLLGHPADLSATVRAIDTKSMLNFVTNGLRMCGAITQTNSCLEAWSWREGSHDTW